MANTEFEVGGKAELGALLDTYEGDIFILNDPYRGNNHPPDFTIAQPVFIGGELLFWSVTKGHQADTGGGGDEAGTCAVSGGHGAGPGGAMEGLVAS